MCGKNISIVTLALCTVINGAFCAPARRGNVQRGNAAVSAAPKKGGVSARAATNAKTASQAAAPAAGKTGGRTTAVRGGGVPAASKVPTVSARAASTQKVVSTGTKVAGAAENVVVSDDCKQIYNGCMDSFCVIENFSGGRCVCSDKYRSFDKLLAEIEEIDQEAFKIANLGEKTIEAALSGETEVNFTSEVSANRISIKQAWSDGEIGAQLKRKAHEVCAERITQCGDKLSFMSSVYDGAINSDCAAYNNALKKQLSDAKAKKRQVEGALRTVAFDNAKNANKFDLGQCTTAFKECMQTTAGCGNDFSKCASVSAISATNSREKDKKQTTYKIQGAVSNIEISASTYDILVAKKPLCEAVFKQCTKVADQVFDVFVKDVAPQLKLAETIAEDNMRKDCIGNVSDCFRNACKDHMDPNDPDGSYDMCLSRPETMLNVCKVQLDACGINSSDPVKARESSIWDYVLARLAAMKVDACTNELKECLSSEDRCGADYSQCVGLSTEQIIRMCPYDKLTGCQSVHDKKLTSNEVYDNLNKMVQGIILNIDNEMLATCEAALETATKRVCGENMDCASLIDLNTFGTTSLEYKICEYQLYQDGFVLTDHCFAEQSMIPDKDLGRVENSVSGELGPVTPYAVLIDVPIYWESISVGVDGNFEGLDDYMQKLEDRKLFMTDKQKERLNNEFSVFKKSLDSVMDSIESDVTVAACMEGRKVSGLNTEKVARFPNLTKQTRTIMAAKLLQKAKSNYYAKYDSLTERSLQDYIKISERQAEIAGENFKDRHRELARQSCVNLAEGSAMPKSTTPPASVGGGIFLGIILALAITAVTVCTFGVGGAASLASVGGLGAAQAAATSTAAAAATAAATASFAATTGGFAASVAASFATAAAATAATSASVVAAGISAAVIGSVGAAVSAGLATGIAVANSAASEAFEYAETQKLRGEYKVEYWNYKEDITTVFNPTDLTCEKCVVYSHCKKTKAPMFGEQYCETWDESSSPQCTTLQM